MRKPKYFIETMQQGLDAGMNAFALQLLAEAFSDDFDKFGDDNVVVLMHDHKGHDVWMVLTKAMPTEADFDRAAEGAALDACKQILHWYEVDSTEFNREMAIGAVRKAIAKAEGRV